MLIIALIIALICLDTNVWLSKPSEEDYSLSLFSMLNNYTEIEGLFNMLTNQMNFEKNDINITYAKVYNLTYGDVNFLTVIKY